MFDVEIKIIDDKADTILIFELFEVTQIDLDTQIERLKYTFFLCEVKVKYN